jgi:hypothetical protein
MTMATDPEHLPALMTKISALSPGWMAEAEDFINFIRLRSQNYQMRAAATRACQLSSENIWDNPDDAAYDAL